MFKFPENGLYIKCSKEEKKKAGDPGKGAQATGALPEKSIKIMQSAPGRYGREVLENRTSCTSERPALKKEMFIMKYLTSDSLNSLFKPFSGWFDNNYSASVMRTDVKSNDKEYTLSIDLPGVDKNNIEISLQDGYLTVQAVRHSEESEKDEKSNYVFRERTYGRMSRSFYVGEGVKEESVKAKYDNGILTVIVPKYNEEEKALKKIAIE